MRLSTMKVGDSVPLYVAPDGEVTAQVRTITPRRIATANARLDFREFELTVATAVSQPIQIWIDDHSRLARVILPAAGITVARSDLATVMAREELVTNSGDASTFIPILGFTAGATVTTPTGSPARHPAVVLVPGFGPQDRDESVGGVPVFGLLAGALADAGYLVVRYDRRGVGQTGGRSENATLEDYRDDLLQVLDWVRHRKDVDADRVAVIGYADGGAIAMLAAQKEDAIKGLGLIAVPGSLGKDYVLEQQTLALAGLHLSEADRAAKIALEHRLIDSALTGKGWETLPPDLSHGADQPIFKSWLLFSPTLTLKKVNQPVLILQGLADAELPRAHADRLAGVARARKRPAGGDHGRARARGRPFAHPRGGHDGRAGEPLARRRHGRHRLAARPLYPGQVGLHRRPPDSLLDFFADEARCSERDVPRREPRRHRARGPADPEEARDRRRRRARRGSGRGISGRELYRAAGRGRDARRRVRGGHPRTGSGAGCKSVGGGG